MKIFRTRSAAAIACAAALSLTASPVLARGWGHHRDRDRVDAGDIFAGLLVIGGIAAIATAASNKSKERREADHRYPDRNTPDAEYRADESYRQPAPNYRNPAPTDGDGPTYGDTRPEYREPTPNLGNAPRETETEGQSSGYGYRSESLQGAVDDCVGEVERSNRQVDSVDTVSRESEGWRVAGRAGGRDFACSVDRDGRVHTVTVDGAAIY